MLDSLLSVFQTTGLGAPYQGEFDPGLVLLSIAIAILAAFIALSLASRITAAPSLWDRWAWTGAGAFAMGGGIWSMHFIGMLAFSLPCGESYNPLITVLSLIPRHAQSRNRCRSPTASQHWRSRRSPEVPADRQ